jgi:hypothetical protein
MTYPGFEPGTFGFQVGNVTNRAMDVVWIEPTKASISLLYGRYFFGIPKNEILSKHFF